MIEAQAEKDTDYEKKCVQLEKMRDLIIKQLFVISNAVKSNNIHSNDILVKIPSTTGEQYEMLEKLKAISDETKENKKLQAKLRNDAQESAQKYAVQLFGIFNRYCRDSTDEALKLQNAYLELKQIHLNVSITIKLMMKPFHPGIDNPDTPHIKTRNMPNPDGIQLVRYYPVYKGETEEQAYVRAFRLCALRYCSAISKTNDAKYLPARFFIVTLIAFAFRGTYPYSLKRTHPNVGIFTLWRSICISVGLLRGKYMLTGRPLRFLKFGKPLRPFINSL